MEIRPPCSNRLICSNCGRKTSYPTDGEYEVMCRAAMTSGGVFIAYCDFCEELMKVSGSVIVFGELPGHHYATGLRGA